MKKKLTVLIFTLLAFSSTVSFFSFAAETQDDNIYCFLTSYALDINGAYQVFEDSSITQFNGIWHFPHSDLLSDNVVDVKIFFKLINANTIKNLSFDFNLLSYTQRPTFNANIYFGFDNTEVKIGDFNSLRIQHFELIDTFSEFYLHFHWNVSPPNSLSFKFDNFVVNNNDVIIINQNDEIISQLSDQNEKLDHLNDQVDTVVDVLQDDSANVDMGTDLFINKIDDLNADVGSFMSGHNFNINSVPANTLSEVGKIGSLASSVISCINLTNNPYLQSTGRTNYVKSELGWYWSILVFTSAFCLVACLLARKGRALSPDAAEHHIESESSDESTYTREKWNPRTQSWSKIGTYRTRSTSNHSSRSSRK